MRKSLVLLTAGALMLSACSSAAPTGKNQTPIKGGGEATQSAEPTTEATPEQKIDPDYGYPIFEAGDMTTTTFPEITGNGPAIVNFTKVRPLLPVYRFSCADCTGEVYMELQDTDMGGAALIKRMDAPVPDAAVALGFAVPDVNSILIDATGNWTLTLDQWANLSEASTTETGRGPRAFRVDPAYTSVTVTYTALYEFDFLTVEAFQQDSRMAGVGGTHNGSGLPETYELDEARTVFIDGIAEWTATFNY